MSVLQYCLGAITFSKSQLIELNACWNIVYRRVFRFQKWESISCGTCTPYEFRFFNLPGEATAPLPLPAGAHHLPAGSWAQYDLVHFILKI